MTDSTSITIDGVTVRRDQHGRFCLTDLHVSAGGAHKHKPSMWLRNRQAQQIIADRLKSLQSDFDPVTTTRGRYGNTYAIKQLVYSYAMWVSPSFHNQVVDAYDAMARVAEPGHVLPTTLQQSLRDMADLLDKNASLTQELVVASAKAGFHDKVGDAKGSQSLTEVAKLHEMTGNALIKLLAAKGVLYSRGGPWLAKQPFITKGYFVTRLGVSPQGYNTMQTRVTGKGQQFIAELVGTSYLA